MTDDEHYATALRRWNAAHRQRDQITGTVIPLTAADRIQIEQAAAKLRTADTPADEEERCELMGLPKNSCSHCRPRPARPIIIDGKPRLFTASFPGRCADCGTPYPAGVTIERLDDGDGYLGACHANQT